jgi:hypothetical protein
MTINASGPISIGGTTTGQSIEIELGLSGTAQASLNCTSLRTLAGVSSGAISIGNFYGKSNRAAVSYTYSASASNQTLNVSSIGGYVAGKSDVVITVNSGIYLWSSVYTTPALTLTGGTTGDTVKLVNKGYIMGKGGCATSCIPQSTYGCTLSSSAGPALKLGFNTTIDNTCTSAYIGGGGGGGYQQCQIGGAGGGAGGGSGNYYGAPHGALGGGASGGAIGCSGADGTLHSCSYYGGGGGGRIFPGSGGYGGNKTSVCASHTGKGGGAGGGGAGGVNYCGVAGGSGQGTPCNGRFGSGGGGGGGWGKHGSASNSWPCAGGLGGKAVCLNGKTVTWVSSCTTRVWGTVS